MINYTWFDAINSLNSNVILELFKRWQVVIMAQRIYGCLGSKSGSRAESRDDSSRPINQEGSPRIYKYDWGVQNAITYGFSTLVLEWQLKELHLHGELLLYEINVGWRGGAEWGQGECGRGCRSPRRKKAVHLWGTIYRSITLLWTTGLAWL